MPIDITHFRKEHVPALRLSISRLKNGWAVTGEHRIEKMLIPAANDFPSSAGREKVAGSWFEVWDKHKNTIYMRQFQMPYMFEAHGEKEHITRQAVPAELVPPIEIIIPYLKQAIYVLLYTTVDHRRGKHAAGTGDKKALPFAMFLRAENS